MKVILKYEINSENSEHATRVCRGWGGEGLDLITPSKVASVVDTAVG